jgi:hypothetical protein
MGPRTAAGKSPPWTATTGGRRASAVDSIRPSLADVRSLGQRTARGDGYCSSVERGFLTLIFKNSDNHGE